MSKQPRKHRASKPRPITLSAQPWDMGQNTAAQNVGKVIESADYVDPETGGKINPNGVRRARRTDVFDLYEGKGVIDKRQATAGRTIRLAYERTMKGPPAIKEIQVDSSPKPDAHIDIIIDRQSKFIAVMSHVAREHREIIDCISIEGNTPAWLKKYRGLNFGKGIAAMQAALTDLADRMGV